LERLMSFTTDTKARMFILLGLLALACLFAGSMSRLGPVRMGRQPDGSFLVSSGQRIAGGSVSFSGRPIDLAVHPREAVFAVLNKADLFLGNAAGVRAGTIVAVGYAASAGFRGLIWSPDGTRLFASTDRGYVAIFAYEGGKLRPKGQIAVQPGG